MSDVQRLKKRILADPEARAIYDEIQPEMSLLNVALQERKSKRNFRKKGKNSPTK